MHNDLKFINFYYLLNFISTEKKKKIHFRPFSFYVGRKVAENIRKIFLIKKPKVIILGGNIKIYKAEDFFKSLDQLIKDKKALKIGNVIYINPRLAFTRRKNKRY